MEIAFSDILISHQDAIVTCCFHEVLPPRIIQFTESNLGPSATFSFVLIIFQISHSLYLQVPVMLHLFFTFSYIMPPPAIISLPAQPHDCIILSSILRWLKEIFSSVLTVKKRVCWIAHAIPDVTKPSTQTPWHKVQQSVNRFWQVIGLKMNREFKPSFIGRNSRQVCHSQRIFVRVFGVSWPIEFCIFIALSKLLWFSLPFMYNLHCLQPKLKDESRSPQS